jgi:hypothetical protein
MAKLSRSASPFDNDYESYENTRDTARLRTEYDMHAAPTPSEKKGPNPKTERLIFIIRLILRIISFLIASSIMAVLAYSAWLYRTTKNADVEIAGDHHGFQSIWVTGLKMRPTYVLLGVSCAATLLNLVILVANFSKAVCCFDPTLYRSF